MGLIDAYRERVWALMEMKPKLYGTQAKLAAKLDISQQAVSKFLRGEGGLAFRTLDTLQKILKRNKVA